MTFDFEWAPYVLKFNFEARTSRAVMHTKRTYFLRLTLVPTGETVYAEVPLFEGLSAEDTPDFEQCLSTLCRKGIEGYDGSLSSVNFALESAMAALAPQPSSPWSRGEQGIAINGLVWMGDKETMTRRVAEKIEAGFKVLKLKIGGINFDDEVAILRSIRSTFGPSDLEIRLDANGSFTPENALERIEELSKFNIHSLEQPIRSGQWQAMEHICRQSPIAIALDEELIGWRTPAESASLLDAIGPKFVILKPALCGGFEAADTYIALASERNIGWWATSALESNVGLYAIARWLSFKHITMPQGLGTGQLYTNNFFSPLELCGPELFCRPNTPAPVPEGLEWRK